MRNSDPFKDTFNEMSAAEEWGGHALVQPVTHSQDIWNKVYTSLLHTTHTLLRFILHCSIPVNAHICFGSHVK